MESGYLTIPHYCSTEVFYIESKRRIQQSKQAGKLIAIATIDLVHFSYVNDLFGYQTGDLILLKLAEHFSRCLGEGEFFNRIHADIFAFCVDCVDYAEAGKRFQRLTDWQEVLQEFLPPHYTMTASGGIVMVREGDEPVSALLDQASYARKQSKGSLTSSFRFYDERMRASLQWQKLVTLSMESALKKREFQMYLQPKVLIQNGQVMGAEALVRWISPEHGLVAPDRFIPVLEQNGFICQLDFFMLSEACCFLRDCAAKGLPQLPISVNFSRVHLTTEHLAERIFQTVNELGISTSLIEIEFTESLSVDSFERLIEVITDLKLLGFKISLDDFGSAYSSLNCLKDLPIDIIKIDKGFLNSSTNTENGKLIIAKMVELIKSLRKLSIMEGVETDDQVDFLRRMRCDFGQGYFYAKPMPVDDYVRFLQKNDVVSDVQRCLTDQLKATEESNVHHISQEFQMDNWELYTLSKSIDLGLMKGHLDGDVTVQYVNDRALEYLGYTRQEFREVFQNSILAFTHPDDVAIVQENANQLIASGKPLQFQTRAIRKDGKVITLQGRSSCVIDEHGRPIGIYAFQDVTDDMDRTQALQRSLEGKIHELEQTVQAEREAREALLLSEERYRAIVEQSDDIMFDWDFTTDAIFFSNKYVAMFGVNPIVEDVTTNQGIRTRLHPDDLVAFEQWVSNTYRKCGRSVAEYRLVDVNGTYIWLNCHSIAICDSEGVPLRAVGVFSNIDAQKYALDELTFKSQRDPLTKLFNKEELRLRTEAILRETSRPGAFFMIDIDNFKGLNDNLGHQLGDAVLIEFTEKLQEFFTENGTVGRIGGDEMAAYLDGVMPEQVAQKAEQLRQALRVTYYGSAAKYNVCGSVGVACYPLHGRTFEELYHLADIALFESKRGGKDCATVYQEHMTGQLKDNRTPVEWSESFLGTYFQGDFPFQIFGMLYETKDLNASVRMILELLGKRFQVDRVYIFQNDPGCQSISNTHEWCAPGIASAQQSLQRVAYSGLDAYLAQYSKEGVLCCSDVNSAIPEIREICEPQNIKSMLHCAIFDEGVMAGFIGFDMCDDYRAWTGEEIAILGYLSRILSVFLIKSDTALELRTSYNNYVDMLENLNGYIYVVNPEDYGVLYVNGAIRAMGISSGEPCYKLAFGEDKPCENCPIQKLSDTVAFATEEIYSRLLKRWISSAASKLVWEQGQDAVLICCTDISKYKTDPPPDEPA